MKRLLVWLALLWVGLAITWPVAWGEEFHVSLKGDDANVGSLAAPLRSISAAATVASAGDVVTVHEGVYREQINPVRGGTSDDKRVVYQAAAGERVVIKGSERITGWEKVGHSTWKVSLPNKFFGSFNPYSDKIHGDWFNGKGREHHTGAVYLNDHWLTEAAQLVEVLEPMGETPYWFGSVDETTTTLWAQFADVDPNQALVEINVRQAVFYPSREGINYLTVRGFVMLHAATPWAPPTAEQVGLIGTNWSKGWIIENNSIQYSTCVGIALGKHGDEYDNTSADTAEGYVKTIQRAVAHGWSRDSIGHHIVRGNRIAHCEQAGVVGSLGAIFSTITDNEIHDIHVRQLFTGAEMAGIKIHAAIDTEISHNHIYRTVQGIWLDWMNQGARVTRNVLHDNNWQDLFVEVNHGPFMVDHNLFLSATALNDMSEGGAYAHNLFAGNLIVHKELSRETPYHPAHDTTVAGLANIRGGDNRFFNNIFVAGNALVPYDDATRALQMAGNVFLNGALPANAEAHALTAAQNVSGTNVASETPETPETKVTLTQSHVYLPFTGSLAWAEQAQTQLVTTQRLGTAAVANLPYVQPDQALYRFDRDFFGSPRNLEHPSPGPFEIVGDGVQTLTVWP